MRITAANFSTNIAGRASRCLFAAVAHIWDSLAEPREARCIQIGLASGTGGKGKVALVLMLNKLLAECVEMPAAPKPDDFDSLEAWHQASMAVFDNEAQRERDLCAHYSAILDGAVIPLKPRTDTVNVP